MVFSLLAVSLGIAALTVLVSGWLTLRGWKQRRSGSASPSLTQESGGHTLHDTMSGVMMVSLPPTSPSLMDDAHRPYFLWWTSATVADLHARLADPDPEVRAYWMGALLREANTRDVWIFVTPEMIRSAWDRLTRHLGRSRAMWAYLLDLPLRPWPPVTDIGR